MRDAEDGPRLLHNLAAGLANMMQLDSDKPLNCIEMDVTPAGHHTLRLSMQRANGRSPLSLKNEAEKLLRQTLEAIETGRSEPLFIMRDAIRNWLEDLPALAAATGTAETSATSAQCEAAQSGGEAVTPNPHQDHNNGR